MKRIPHARGVAQALRSVTLAAQESLKGLNQAASQQMAKGDYATAEALAAKGRELKQFQSEVDALRKCWREVCGATPRGSTKAATPLWAYYHPILQALAQAGGEARRAEIEPEVGVLMSATLLAADRERMAGGRERWQVMIQRARKGLVAEDWIEERTGSVWRITETGRRAAEKPITAARQAGG